jgi:hypothetical protein
VVVCHPHLRPARQQIPAHVADCLSLAGSATVNPARQRLDKAAMRGG